MAKYTVTMAVPARPTGTRKTTIKKPMIGLASVDSFCLITPSAWLEENVTCTLKRRYFLYLASVRW